MKLSELLDYTGKDYLDDRTDMLDGEPDELWSDATLVRYFNEAQRRLCRRSWVITDVGHPTAGVIVLQEGKYLYDYHKSVMHIYSAVPADTDSPLGRTTEGYLGYQQSDDPDFFDINQVYTRTPGRPYAVSLDAGTRTMRVVPTPTATETGLRVLLRVARMPVKWLSLDDVEAEPEIPEEYHLALATYAAGRCLTHPNVDASAKTEGRQFLADFEKVISEARQDRQRREAVPIRFAYASSTALIR